jgi:hypothetical protein
MSELGKQFLVVLVTAHFLGDFIFQSDIYASLKRRPFILLKHAFVIAASSYILCGIWYLWQIPLFIFLTHGLTDYIKARLKKESAYSFVLDQALHLAIISVIAILVAKMKILSPNESSTFWVGLLGKSFLKYLILMSGLIVAVKAGGPLIGLAVKPFTDQLQKSGEGMTMKGVTNARGFENGGKVIGYLERSLIFLFILIGQPEGIGFLIAAKSILRFGEIKDHENRMEAEYIIIGTLMSFGYGIFIAYVTKYFLEII